MEINWEPYDLFDEFLVFDAACLWLEMEPTRDLLKDMPGSVRAMIQLIEQEAGGRFSTVAVSTPRGTFGPEPVSRAALVQMAEAKNQKPKFLFPELRGTESKPIERPLLSKERQTVLKLILGMAQSKYRFDPDARRSSVPGAIKADLERYGIKIDEDTVRRWLQEAAEHREDLIE